MSNQIIQKPFAKAMVLATVIIMDILSGMEFDLFVIYQGFTSKDQSPIFEPGQTPAAQEVSEGFVRAFLANHGEEGRAFFEKVVFE